MHLITPPSRGFASITRVLKSSLNGQALQIQSKTEEPASTLLAVHNGGGNFCLDVLIKAPATHPQLACPLRVAASHCRASGLLYPTTPAVGPGSSCDRLCGLESCAYRTPWAPAHLKPSRWCKLATIGRRKTAARTNPPLQLYQNQAVRASINGIEFLSLAASPVLCAGYREPGLAQKGNIETSIPSVPWRTPNGYGKASSRLTLTAILCAPHPTDCPLSRPSHSSMFMPLAHLSPKQAIAVFIIRQGSKPAVLSLRNSQSGIPYRLMVTRNRHDFGPCARKSANDLEGVLQGSSPCHLHGCAC